MAKRITCQSTTIDIDAMFKNNTPYLNFWYQMMKEGLLEYDKEDKCWYPMIDFIFFDPISKIESRNQLFRDWMDEMDIIWEDFTDI